MRNGPITMDDLLRLPGIRGRRASAIIDAQPWSDEDARSIRGVGPTVVRRMAESGLIARVYRHPVHQPHHERHVDTVLVESLDAAIVALQQRAAEIHRAVERLRAMRDEETG